MKMYLCVYQLWSIWSYTGRLGGSCLVSRKPPVSPWIHGSQRSMMDSLVLGLKQFDSLGGSVLVANREAYFFGFSLLG